jgi:hypothetical protein
MRYVGTALLAMFLCAAASSAWAADEAPSGFYALSNLGSVKGDVARLKPLSDVQLGAVEGSSRFNPWSNHNGAREMRKLMFEYFLYRFLTDLFRGGGVISPPGQNNFLIQLNVAIGNHISQTNNGFQYNNASSTSQSMR